MRRRKGPRKKKQWTAGKKQALRILGKKRLSPTKKQRESHRKALEKLLGYKIPKLSEVVGKPSRHTVKKRAPKYEVKTEWQPSERKIVGYKPDPYGWGNVPIYETTPGKEVVLSKKLVGEKLIVKRLRKMGHRSGGSKRGEGPVRYGSSASVRVQTKKTKHKRGKSKGQRSKKEKRKKKGKKRKKR